jgi:hypothetical protein
VDTTEISQRPVIKEKMADLIMTRQQPRLNAKGGYVVDTPSPHLLVDQLHTGACARANVLPCVAKAVTVVVTVVGD